MSLQNSAETLLAIPHHWDNLYATSDWRAVYIQVQGDGDLQDARRAMICIASGDHVYIEQHLDRLPKAGALVRAARLFCLVALRRHEEVLAYADDLLPRSSSLLDLEDACGAAFMVAMSATEQRRYSLAFGLQHTVVALAAALGMTSRQQHAALEMERLRTLVGKAQPDAVRRALEMRQAKPARLAWAAEVEAEAHLSLGQYAQARDALPEGHDLRGFAQALLGDPCCISSALGRAVMHLRGECPDFDCAELAEVTEDPLSGYAALLLGLVALRDGRYADIPELIGHVAPNLPDQRVTWAMLRWAALARGHGCVLPHALMDDLGEGWSKLGQKAPLVKFLGVAAPVLVLMAAWLLRPPDEALEVAAGLPLLVGEHLLLHGELVKLPGRSNGAQVLVLQDMGEDKQISRVERLRLKRALEAMNLPWPPVPVSAVLWALRVMVQSSTGEERVAWLERAHALMERMTGRAAQRRAQILFADLA